MLINDSGLEIDKDFLEPFLEESMEVLSNLKGFVISFSDPSQTHFFEQFAQQIDRIMGAAYTLSLNFIGDLAKMGKELGYKSSQLSDPPRLLVLHSLLSQLTNALEGIFKEMRRGRNPNYDNYQALLKRLSSANQSLGSLRATLEN